MNNYLSILKNKIRSLPDGYRREILSDYENHFKEGLSYGKTEEDIIEELGDVDFIARNIIAEYYIDNYESVNSTKDIIKALSAVGKVGFNALNLLIVAPMIFCITLTIILTYVVDVLLILMPLFLIVSLIVPSLPISFGTDILWKKVLEALGCAGIGFIIYRSTSKRSARFFNWAFRYIIKSLKFEVFSLSNLK